MRIDAPLGARALAHLIDLIPIFLIYVIVFLELGEATSFIALSLLGSVLVISIALYFSFFELIFSTTPGKKVMGLYVISIDPIGPLTPRQAIARNILRFTDLFLLYLPIIPLKKRIGDLLSGTAVVSSDLSNVRADIGKEAIAEALAPFVEEKLSKTDPKVKERLLSFASREELPDFVASLETSDEVKYVISAVIRYPKRFEGAFSPREVALIYKRASQLAYRPEEREALSLRAELVEALSSSRRGMNFYRGIKSLKTVSREFRPLVPYFLFSASLLFLISFLAAIYRPDPLIRALREIFSSTDSEVLANVAYVFTVIFMNNLRVAILLLGLSPTVVIPLLMLLVNGLVIGGLLGTYAAEGKALEALILIMPHGVPELTAIFTVTALSLKAAHIVLTPPEEGRVKALRKLFLGSLELLLVVVLLLLYAAFIEAAVTKQISKNLTLGVSFSLLELIVIYALLLWRKGQ